MATVVPALADRELPSTASVPATVAESATAPFAVAAQVQTKDTLLPPATSCEVERRGCGGAAQCRGTRRAYGRRVGDRRSVASERLPAVAHPESHGEALAGRRLGGHGEPTRRELRGGLDEDDVPGRLRRNRPAGDRVGSGDASGEEH